MGIVKDEPVMADNLDIGMLRKQSGLVDPLVVDSCQYDIFGSALDGTAPSAVSGAI